MRTKHLLVALGFAGAIFSASANGTALSSNIISQPLLGAYTFFDTDEEEMRKNVFIDMHLRTAKKPSDLDALLGLGVDFRVVNGLKLNMMVNSLPSPQKEEFKALLDEAAATDRIKTLENRDTAIYIFLGLVIAAMGLAVGRHLNKDNNVTPT